jgi:hypothetical protein
MLMRVSVIVPLYNKASYITRALDSIAAQTFGDFEVIVVDDGSTDSSGQRASAHPDKRVRVLHQSNAGPGSARNRGIAEAQGDLLAFLDADDEWMPDYLESSVCLLDQCDTRVAATTSGYIEFPKGISSESMWRDRGLKEGVQQVTPFTPAVKLVYMLAYMSPCSTVARATAVRRWGGFYDKNRCTYAEDAVLWLKVLLNEAVHFQMRPLACFHREASSLSGNYAGARPIEPFLLQPNEVAAACPMGLLTLLRKFYSIRACKTASVLGYWGAWEAARPLFKQFVRMRDWRLPYFTSALIGCTPVAGMLGRLLEAARSEGN